MTELIIECTGNVFDDLGLENAGELSLKAALAVQVASIVTHRHLTQREAGEILGVPQSHVSKIVNGKLDGITAERLMRMLLKLGRDVDIVIKTRRTTVDPGRLRVGTSKRRTYVKA